MFKRISQKLNLLMAREGISGMQLARNLGIPASTIKKIRSQEITNPTVATLLPIARYFSVTLEYLLEATNDLNHSTLKHPPLISWEEAIGTYNQKKTFALVIDHREETIFPIGSFLIVDPTSIPKHGDFVLAAKKENPKATLKQFLCAEGENYLRSFNSVISLRPEYYLLGVVVEYHKQFKNNNTKKSMETNQC